MRQTRLERLVIATILCASFCASRLPAQQRFDPPADIIPLAVTYCHQTDSVAPAFSVSYINMQVIGTDSLDEARVHEAYHDRMNRDSLSLVGHCPGPRGDVRSQLAREIGAYCASDSVRVKRTHSIAEVGGVTVARLVQQFDGRLLPVEIVRRWAAACPSFALPLR